MIPSRSLGAGLRCCALVAGLLLAACDNVAPFAAASPAAAPVGAGGRLAIGTNVDGLAYWSAALPVIDLMKSAGQWMPQSDAVYDTGDAVALDGHGWVTALPATANYTRLNLNVLHDNAAAPTKIRYVVLYSGAGTMRVAAVGGSGVVSESPGRLVVRPAENGNLYLQITATDPWRRGDYLRDIHIVREDLLSRFEAGEVFNPAFVDKVRPFAVLRFMDWMNTNVVFDHNGKPLADGQITAAPMLDWADRASLSDMRWSDGSRGVPIEALVELANSTGAEPWFNMPVNASDDYIRSFATYVRDHLRGRGHIHVEFSNEVWNGSFPQARYAAARAAEAWGPGTPGMEWYGKRAAEVGMIWNRVFGEPIGGHGDPGRVLVVYNTQFGWKGLEDLGLDTVHWRDAKGEHVRASDYFNEYAITGYYDGTMNTAETAGTVKGWWRDPDGGYARAVKVLHDRIETFNAPSYAYHAAKAGQHGLRLVTYESGFGESTPIVEHQNDAYTDFLAKLQRRPEFYDLEMANYAAFKRAGGSLYMNFGIISAPSKWGNWSALESVTQATSPRYRALTDWIAANPAGGAAAGK